jgi:hypothetical protein
MARKLIGNVVNFFDWAGGKVLPDGGRDDILQAGDKVMLTSEDTVSMLVRIQTLRYEYRGCRFQTGDHVPGTLEIDHKWLLDVELEHLVEGAVDKESMGCIFESCTYAATEEWSGTKEELLFVLEEHMRKMHPITTVELVDDFTSIHELVGKLQERLRLQQGRVWGGERCQELSVQVHW